MRLIYIRISTAATALFPLRCLRKIITRQRSLTEKRQRRLISLADLRNHIFVYFFDITFEPQLANFTDSP
jgi:hypothetical protein